MSRYNKPIFLKGDFQSETRYLPLPLPVHEAPYRLDLKEVTGNEKSDELTFHIVGDTGSFKDLDFQNQIAGEIVKNAEAASTDFLYHLGDVVYHHGEASEYPQQFLTPYQSYPSPIFAIAGNHDGEINPDAATPYRSLEAFMQVFCSDKKAEIPFANGSSLQSMNQPYVYWTLETPLAIFIGLYANVSKFGSIDATQREWFKQELKNANLQKEEKAIVVTVHHSPYSADTNHGSSLYMIDFLESAFLETGVWPDLVISGHVHNYQRFQKTYEDGKVIPFIVAGAGGYAILHPIAELGDPQVSDQHESLDSVELKKFCDDQHGFLKISIKRNELGLKIHGTYYAVRHTKGKELETYLYDRFEVGLNRHAELDLQK